MNTDDRFRHFFLETTNQTQLSAFLSQSACNILSPFPIGLSTSIGLIVANPAFSGDMSFANSTTSMFWEVSFAASLGIKPVFSSRARLHTLFSKIVKH
jgi:hypothetical protein